MNFICLSQKTFESCWSSRSWVEDSLEDIVFSNEFLTDFDEAQETLS